MNSVLFLKQCLSEVIVEPVQEAKLRCSICGGHAQGKQWPNQDKGRGICSQCAAKMKTDGREDIGQSYGKEGTHYHIGEETSPLIITPTGQSDEWSRPVYKGQDGKIYVDINLGNGTPSIHSVTDEGEPNIPIHNYQIGNGEIVNEGDEADAVHDMHADAEADHYEKHYGNSPKKKALKTSKTNTTKKSKAIIKIKGKEMKLENFIKQCLSEVIVEPASRKRKVYGNPQRLQATHFIKECILEVLKDNLMEGGFDPQSQAGPNSPSANPYPEWNNKMAKMEELDEPYGKPYASKKTDIKDYIYTIDIVRWAVKYLGTAEFKTRVKKLLDKTGASSEEKIAHNIEFVAREALNQCKMQINEGNSEEDAWVKYERGYNTGQSTRRTGQKSTPSNSVELVGYQDAILGKKKSIPDIVRNTIKETDPHGRYAQTAGAGQFDPRTFGVNGGIDDVTESHASQSTEIEWQCPYCKQITQIPVEIESPSDYIACADCEHCGKEINDPKLDQKVYQKVIDYYAGKADYLHDTLK